MVESTTQQQTGSEINLGPAQTQKRYVMIIGSCDHGKSTFKKNLIGVHENIASDVTTGFTKDFQSHSSIFHELTDTIFIDSPGLNETQMPLQHWLAKYNSTVGQQNALPLSLVVLVVQSQVSPSPSACKDFAMLLSCVTELRVEKFVVVFNKCEPNYTVSQAIEFFSEAVQTLDDSAQKSNFELTEQQVLLFPAVDQKIFNFEVIEGWMNPHTVQFVLDNLTKILSQPAQITTVQVKDYKITSVMRGGSKSTYTGDMLNCKRHGRGKSTWTNGNEYEGEWQYDKEHGRGKYTWASGDVYDGEYKDGEWHGRGKMTSEDGDVYDGEWQDGRKHGRGKKTWVEGDMYDGEWQYGQYHGRGKYIFADGDVYDGEWVEGDNEGRGKKTSADGAVYDGEYKNNQKHGRGSQGNEHGDFYDGSWFKNKKHGMGTFTPANEEPWDGIWENGTLKRKL